jgi:CheY-like chemotaxis protein
MLGVAVASVAKWVDTGDLKAGRTPGGHRRINTADLVEFVQRHKLSVPPELRRTSRILIVDDEMSIINWLSQEIREAYPDVEVRGASDGYSAGEVVASWHPDVVILDLRMEGLDGFDVCRRIKARAKTKQAEVIAITAYPSEEVKERICQDGARACFEKPLDTAKLLAEISVVLKK